MYEGGDRMKMLLSLLILCLLAEALSPCSYEETRVMITNHVI